MVLLVLSIGFLKNLMDLLVDVLNPLNESRWLCWPQNEHGKNMSLWLQEVVQHQWDPRVGIPAPPERGYGRWSYGEPYCSFDEHREDSHPMYAYA
jgi:hypothetical protein